MIPLFVAHATLDWLGLLAAGVATGAYYYGFVDPFNRTEEKQALRRAKRWPGLISASQFEAALEAVETDRSQPHLAPGEVHTVLTETADEKPQLIARNADRLRTHLGHDSGAVHHGVAYALSCLASTAPELAVEYSDTFEALLRDDHDNVRNNATFYFSELVPEYAEQFDAAAAEMVDLCRDPDAHTRANVVDFFVKYCRERPAEAQSIPELEAQLRWLSSDGELHTDVRVQAERTADFVASCRDDPNVGPSTAQVSAAGSPPADEDPEEALADVPREEWKYEDPQAELNHRRAQQRDPSEVAELGDEIEIVLREVDYSAHPPTIRGTKNKLNVFVVDAPDDLERLDEIRGKVVDYGGKNNSLEVSFLEKL